MLCSPLSLPRSLVSEPRRTPPNPFYYSTHTTLHPAPGRQVTFFKCLLLFCFFGFQSQSTQSTVSSMTLNDRCKRAEPGIYSVPPRVPKVLAGAGCGLDTLPPSAPVPYLGLVPKTPCDTLKISFFFASELAPTVGKQEPWDE